MAPLQNKSFGQDNPQDKKIKSKKIVNLDHYELND